jgi:PAS domain S-box-containing protein
MLPSRVRLGIVLVLAVIAAVLLIWLYPPFGRIAYAFAAIPVVAAAGLMGLRVGLLAFAISVICMFLLSPLIGQSYLAQLNDPVGVVFTTLVVLATAFFGRMHDLSQRLHEELQRRDAVEKSLVEAQRLNKRITESIPDTIWIWELESKRVVYLNQQPGYLPGLTVEQLKQEGLAPLQALVHPDDLNAYLTSEIVRQLPDEDVHRFEYRVRQLDGSYRWVKAQEVVFSRHDDGRPRYILNVEQDITAERQMQEATLKQEKLQYTLEKERELSHIRIRLMETISHEFRTPLSIIMASGELLEMYLERMSPERRAECLSAIKTQTVHLREMLNDLNTVLEQEFRPPRFQPQPTDLKRLCESLIEMARLTMGSQHRLELQMQGDPGIVETDPSLLQPILQNLLSNAFKYSPAGSTVQLAVERTGAEVIYRVRDSGMGIAPDDQSHIFDTFYRARNTVATSGLGLGLKIVRDYVRLHQGTVTVSSQPGKGTTFTVRLPTEPAPPKTT